MLNKLAFDDTSLVFAPDHWPFLSCLLLLESKLVIDL